MNFGHLLIVSAVVTFIAVRLYQDPKAKIELYSNEIIILTLFCFLSIIYNVVQMVRIKKLEKANKEGVKIETLDDIFNAEQESVEDNVPNYGDFKARTLLHWRAQDSMAKNLKSVPKQTDTPD